MKEKKNVCVDLDGVLAHYNGWRGVAHIGDPLPGALELVKALAEKYNVLIFTGRTNYQLNWGELADRTGAHEFNNDANRGINQDEAVCIVEKWLRKNGFSPFCSVWPEAKPMAVAFIDDHAVGVVHNCKWSNAGRYQGAILRTVDGLAK